METLRYGARGSGVRLMQLALKRAGSYKGEIDGVFGTRTLNSVRRFQSAAGLTPDGAYGIKTRMEAEPYLIGSAIHKLKPGDTFYRLGKSFGISADDIALANPGLDPADLTIGKTIVLPLVKSVVPTDIPYSSELMKYVSEGLTLRYPLIKTETIGFSEEGNPLYLFKAGSGKAKVFINAAHHANEWITAPLILDLLETLAKAYASKTTVCGRNASALLSGVTLYAVPMVDPDGVDIVNGAAGKSAFAKALAIAENYPDIPFPSGWKANAEGTDLNLNYPAGWEEAKRIKYSEGYSSPAPRDYVGPAPLSAAGSRALYELSEANDFSLTISYHTQGGEIYWKYGDIEPEGSARIAARMAEASGYRAADVPYESGFAGYKDWFIDRFRRPGFTVEAGYGTNPLPLSQYDTIRADNFPLIVTAMEAAADK
ncbi:MAG: peptidoglycan-binding protein [Clostridia bacterium]|nr:peptidoglycan-binding protein [Clostridia bacterium]